MDSDSPEQNTCHSPGGPTEKILDLLIIINNDKNQHQLPQYKKKKQKKHIKKAKNKNTGVLLSHRCHRNRVDSLQVSILRVTETHLKTDQRGLINK